MPAILRSRTSLQIKDMPGTNCKHVCVMDAELIVFYNLFAAMWNEDYWQALFFCLSLFLTDNILIKVCRRMLMSLKRLQNVVIDIRLLLSVLIKQGP